MPMSFCVSLEGEPGSWPQGCSIVSRLFLAQVWVLIKRGHRNMWGLQRLQREGKSPAWEKKGRGKINKVSCPLPCWVTLASCLCQKVTSDQRVPAAATGSGPPASELVLKYPKSSGCQSRQRKDIPLELGILKRFFSSKRVFFNNCICNRKAYFGYF